jgi:beta-lactamase regulating signal transducer with metallopeptidase domain
MMSDLLAVISGGAAALVRAAGWEVLFAAVLFALVFGLTRLLRNASPVLRHALWGLVLLRLVAPVELATPVSLGSLTPGWFTSSSLDGLTSSIEPAGDAGEDGAGASGQAMVTGDAAENWWPAALVATWLLGVGIVGASVHRRRRRYRDLVRRASPVADERVRAMVRDWRRTFRIRRAVRAVTSGEQHSPFTLGAARPVVFLPRAVLEHDDRSLLESVIAHELAHVRRWDDLFLGLQQIISVLYFFNPIAWLSAGRMREESERACDELVISRGGITPRSYGRSIVTVLRLGLESEPVIAPALGNPLRKQRARLETIMKVQLSSTSRLRSLYPLPAAFILGLFLLPMAEAPTGVGAADAAAAVVQQSDDVRLSNPLPGSTITSRFGPAQDPFSDEEIHHDGIDIKASPGSEILAPADGLVALATAEYSGGAGYGTVVLVDHGGGLKTFYAHLDSYSVQEGERVSRGDALGVQGSSGRSTGPHLHFEVWLDGERRDPALFVSDWRTERF